MTFYDLIDQVSTLLRQRGRLSYRALKRQFELDDDRLDDLKFELIEVQRIAADQDDTILVLLDAASNGPADSSNSPATAPAPAAPPGERETTGGDQAERRQLSVLFCDLAGSTALAAEMDPEELRDVLRAYQAACARVIERYEGVVARQVGDGLLVTFGYPQAHEDDAGRAARAGLAIVASLPELNAQLARRAPVLRAHPLHVRIGVDTGLVVVGALGESTYRDPMAVVGETPNIAARLQALAPPDGVIVSGATYRLLGRGFVCEALGPRELRGVSTPVEIYRVLGEPENVDLLETAREHRQPALIGRDQELEMLLDRWEQSKEGLGQVVLLSGEAGIGKSRLVQELKARVAGDDHLRLDARGSPFHQQSAFHPLINLLQRALLFDAADSPETKREKLIDGLQRYGVPIDPTVPALARLLGLPGEPTSAEAARQQRQETLDALLYCVLRPAVERPVLMIVEDLHWVDPSTLEMLQLLIEQVPTARVLIVLTARPRFRDPWRGRAHFTRMTLQRLRRAQIERLATEVAGGKTLPAEVAEQVARKTDGVPLFVEELIKMVLESALVREEATAYVLTGPLPPLAIPATLQDSLMARLDRLATTKTVAQLGATIGRTFTFELLRAVAGLDETALTVELHQLVEAELLQERGLPPDATYSFKHALIQEAAYQTLLRSTRQQYHQRVARTLEASFRDTVETQPEVVAHHYTEAGLGGQAVPYWQRAGLAAIERSANREAVAHLTRALDALAMTPDGPERKQQELDLQTSLAPALMAHKGYAAPEVAAAYDRARELCHQVGQTPRLIRVLLGLGTFYFVRGELEAARDLGAEGLAMAERLNDGPRLRQAHLGIGSALFHLGDLHTALSHLERGAAVVDAPQSRPRPVPAIADPQVACESFAGLTRWALGYPDQALDWLHRALARTEGLSHPFTSAHMHAALGWVHQLRQEPELARQWAERNIAGSTTQGFPIGVAQGHIVRGWALTRQGQAAEGIAELREGCEAWRALGAEMFVPQILAMLAEGYGTIGQVEEGLALLAEAFATVEKTKERWAEAELHRLTGSLKLMRSLDAHEEAETCFRQALDLAARQQAKSFELRAAISLSRLRLGHSDRVTARKVLDDVYRWFTEGFETADLREARALLETLTQD